VAAENSVQRVVHNVGGRRIRARDALYEMYVAQEGYFSLLQEPVKRVVVARVSIDEGVE